MRIAFNFYRSYYDVLNELSEKDQLLYLRAILDRQFKGIEPELEGMARFAYLSQKFNIDKQVKGWEDKTNLTLLDPIEGGIDGGTQGGSVQEEEKGKEEEKEERPLTPKGESIDFDKLIIVFNDIFNCSSRVVNATVRKKYNALLKQGYTKENIKDAMYNASKDPFHIDSGYKHCTLEFFSRPDKVDKFINFKHEIKHKTNEDLYAEHVMKQIRANS